MKDIMCKKVIDLVQKQTFINNYITILYNQYNNNRWVLSRTMQDYNMNMTDFWERVKESKQEDTYRYQQINELVKQQVYIQQMIQTGRALQDDYRKNDP